LDIRQLRYFVTVHEEMSFTKAAKRLFVSQPTLSKAIKNMESELNEPLFDRESSVLRLTDVGEALLARAKIILKEFDSISTRR
jgi:DNA-binding transcriptional LysR family regulator